MPSVASESGCVRVEDREDAGVLPDPVSLQTGSLAEYSGVGELGQSALRALGVHVEAVAEVAGVDHRLSDQVGEYLPGHGLGSESGSVHGSGCLVDLDRKVVDQFSLEAAPALAAFTAFDSLHTLAGRGALLRVLLRRPE